MIPESKKKTISILEKGVLSTENLLKKTEKKSFRSGWLRLGILAAGTTVYFSLYFASQYSASVISAIISLLLFIYASIIQNRLISLAQREKKWIEIKKSHIARARLDWQKIPHFKNFEELEQSILESDLDLTGNRSLHQLLDYTGSKEGSLLLRDFLTSHPGNGEVIINRQNIIKELLTTTHFREHFLLINTPSAKKEITDAPLLKWLADSKKVPGIRKTLFILFPLYAINLLMIILMLAGILSPVFGIFTFIYAAFNFFFQGKISVLISSAEQAGESLKNTAGILSFLEEYNFGKKELLAGLAAPLKNKSESPSRLLNKLNSHLGFISMRNNPIVFLLYMLLFPLDFFLAYRIEIHKSAVAANLGGWLASRHLFEVFVSLSVFAELNPDYSFPEINTGDRSTIEINAVDMGHPLIASEVKVCNNYKLSGLHKISIVTGSNMSGKSTFLRTIGINLCLAYTGAPVNAVSFSTTAVRLFTCIKVSDSVIDGISYFYAEVKRLKLLLDEIEKEGKPPLLYLIDEIFKGTNNIERLQGSRALIKLLASKKGSGLVSTHDLELVKLSESASSITNYHFREEIKEGKMIFGYKLNDGPCPTTNALVIMKANGLPVE